MLNAEKLVGLMAESDRRRVIAALILASGDVEDLVARTGLKPREVVDALDRLERAELIERASDGTIILLEQAFKIAARNGASTPETGPFVDGRLVHLPRKRSKRLVVLDQLAQKFEPGIHYSERQVNHILAAFDSDFATLRRYLVDERFLDRADGQYWRSGGTVELPDGDDG